MTPSGRSPSRSPLIGPAACDYAVGRIVSTYGSERLIVHDAREARVAFPIDHESCNWLDGIEAERVRVFQTRTIPTRSGPSAPSGQLSEPTLRVAIPRRRFSR